MDTQNVDQVKIKSEEKMNHLLSVKKKQDQDFNIYMENSIMWQSCGIPTTIDVFF